MAKKKFDTNPLDPDFPQRVTETQQAETASQSSADTRKFQPFSVAEEPTRRYETPNFAPPYVPPFDGQNVPQQAHQTVRFADMNRSNTHKVDKIGLPENILTAIPYIPFWIGLIAGVIILFIVPKSEAKVRFHASQGLAAHLAILLITLILSGIGSITDVGNIGSGIFQIVTTIMLIIFAVKAWQGKPVHIESVDDLTEWLEEKVQPRK
ncbi:MAG: hypothetical protein ACR2L1_08970 [Pyrinomonadaceae bacterium]